ncbi:MAG TPA: EAL domain-containing protein [Gallionella sp.]|nr:EAL domain-containing protein [Gallionella sp.]
MKIENTFSADTKTTLASILLVDDSAVNLGVVVEGFESHGYDVLVALDGEEALQRAGVARPDIILLDVMMPGMDGFEVCRRLKANERTRDIPVIFMTSLGGIQDKVKGFEVGAVDYITKPLQIEEARARINAHLELRALRQSLEKKNNKLQFEIAEREKAEAELREKVEQISELNSHLEIQAVELTASRERLRLTEEWYRGIVRSAPDGMVVVDPQGRIVLVNEPLERMFGYGEGELLGQPMEILLPAAVRGGHVAKREGFFADGHKGRPMDAVLDGLRACRKDGGEFPVDVSLSRLPEVGGREGAICAAIRDITVRKQAEQVLEETRNRLSGVLKTIPDLVWLKNADGVYLSCNHAFERFFGAKEADIVGKTDYDFVDAELADFFRVKDREAEAAGCVCINEEWVQFADDGRMALLETRKVPVYGADGKLYGVMGIGRDITDRRLMEEALAAREREFRTLLENTPDVVARFDRECRRIYVNPAWERVNGIAAQDAIGKSPLELSVRAKSAAADLERTLRDVLASGRAEEMELVWQEETGGLVCFALSAIPEFDNRGEVACVLTVARDISERKLMEAALAAREQESRTLIENSPDTVARYDRDCRRRYVNPAFGAMVEGGVAVLLGKTPSEYPGGANAVIYESKINEVFASGEDAEFELKWADKDGGEVCSLIRLTAERDASGQIATVLAVGRDITELNAYRQKIHQMAFYDSLTSLPNRALFNDRLRQMLTDASWHGQLAGVMLLDLDRFKAVNDSLGHPAGDELLREAAARLTCSVRGYDTVARLGGDEFAILLPELRTGDDLGRIASKILESFSVPFLLEGTEVFVSCSIGIALYPDDATDGDDLIKHADSAMYFAKRSGRNNFRFYSRALTSSANERLSLETDLRHGFARGELELYFQPKVNLADGLLVGSEALLRWHHPERGMVPPDQFISIAEDSGMIVEIGEWVLRDACRVACEWNGPGKPLHKVAINLSARQFQSNDLTRTVHQVLEETGCYPEWIELEITESLLLDEDGEVLDTLLAICDMGITIAIDDFGTGYSALSYLARFPIDTLKIDRSFTSRVTEEGHHAELVKAIISIAHSLDLQVVAEGVETLDQAIILQAYGCHVAQGYLYSKPVSQSAFEALPQSFG